MAAFMSVLHMYESFGWWRRADYLKVHFAESWNEMHHLLIMEVIILSQHSVNKVSCCYTLLLYKLASPFCLWIHIVIKWYYSRHLNLYKIWQVNIHYLNWKRRTSLRSLNFLGGAYKRTCFFLFSSNTECIWWIFSSLYVRLIF